MMRPYLSLLWTLLLVSNSRVVLAAPDTAQPTPAQPEAVFGRKTVALLTGATRVETFLIGGDGSDSANLLERRQYARQRYGVRAYREINRYPITAVGPVQGAAFTTRLKQTLFDLPAYPYNSISCFDPGVGFRIWRGRETVEMIVCFLCHHQIVVTKDAQGRIIHKRDIVNSPLLLTLAAEAFPHDQDLQKLKREDAMPPSRPQPQPVMPDDPDEAAHDALVRAARDDNQDAVRAALARLSMINTPDHSGEVALMYAIRNGDQAMVSALLDKGLPADGEGMWRGQALFSACGTRQKEIA